MIFSVNSNLSALRAFGVKMGVSANNVANVNTDEFKKSRAILQEGPGSRVQVDIERIDSPGHPIIEVDDMQIIERESSNVDLAEEIPGTILTQRGYEANLTTIKTQDEMFGNIIDMIG